DIVEAQKMMTRLNLDPDAEFQSLSAGMKRRVLFAGAMACNPDLLLLDEPTNHLDIKAIDQLEDLLVRYKKTLLFVTHDRMFLKKIATRIVELDRGELFNWACDYETYLKRREEMLETEEKQHARFDKKLAQEEQWLRKGIKARRTRNEGRVRALTKMREERRQRREHAGT
ncbi:MAG: ATP-binding cassette domain-containing protein, partial [Deltaproteobacteria bacterium]|nr:ATP-binding cassette domain-containing protein [Deltaproteobacteria bacterium]